MRENRCWIDITSIRISTDGHPRELIIIVAFALVFMG